MNSFITLVPGDDAINIFTAVIYELSLGGICILGRAFKLSLMFLGKSRSLSTSGEPESCFTG